MSKIVQSVYSVVYFHQGKNGEMHSTEMPKLQCVENCRRQEGHRKRAYTHKWRQGNVASAATEVGTRWWGATEKEASRSSRQSYGRHQAEVDISELDLDNGIRARCMEKGKRSFQKHGTAYVKAKTCERTR